MHAEDVIGLVKKWQLVIDNNYTASVESFDYADALAA
jgi:hypothetical protein